MKSIIVLVLKFLSLIEVTIPYNVAINININQENLKGRQEKGNITYLFGSLNWDSSSILKFVTHLLSHFNIIWADVIFNIL